MSETGVITTATEGAFTVQSNSAPTDQALSDSLKVGREAKPEKADEVKAAPEGEAQAEKTESKEAEQVVETKDASPDTEGTPEVKKEDPKRSAKARMHEATRKEAEAKRALAEERARFDAELQQVRDELAALRRGEKPEVEKDPFERPKIEDFEDYEKYLDARDEWNFNRLEAQRQQEFAERRAREAAARRESQQGQAIKKYSDAFKDQTVIERISEDLLEVEPHFMLENPRSANAHNWLATEIVMSGEAAPDIMLWLTEHSEEMEKIAKLRTPREVAKAFARIEDKVASQKTVKPQSKALPPIKPLGGSPPVSEVVLDATKMGFDEYAKRRLKELRGA